MKFSSELRKNTVCVCSVLPYHLQQVLLQRFHCGERLHLQHATRPVNQSRLTWCPLQTETQPPCQDLNNTKTTQFVLEKTHIHTNNNNHPENTRGSEPGCDSPADCRRSLECHKDEEVDVQSTPRQQSVYGLRQQLGGCKHNSVVI